MRDVWKQVLGYLSVIARWSPLGAVGVVMALGGCRDGAEKVSTLDEPGETQQLAFDTVAVIDGSGTTNANGLLGVPVFVRTDSTGRVFVADRATMQIKVYDSTGLWLKDLGKRGDGPGEFNHITALDVDRRGDIYVADELARRFTSLSIDGDVLFENSFDPQTIAWPRSVRVRGDGTVLMAFKMPTNRGGARTDDNHFLLHEFDRELRRSRVGVSFDVFWPRRAVREPVGNVFAQFTPGVFAESEDGTVFYAPSLYEGEFYAFSRIDDEPTMTYTGAGGASPSLVTITQEEADREAQWLTTWRATYNGVEYPIRVLRKAIGLFELSNGDVAVFDQVLDGDTVRVRIERFGRDGRSIALQEIMSFPVDGTGGYPPRVAWVDPADKLYLIEYQPTPRVTVLKILLADAHGAS